MTSTEHDDVAVSGNSGTRGLVQDILDLKEAWEQAEAELAEKEYVSAAEIHAIGMKELESVLTFIEKQGLEVPQALRDLCDASER